MVFYYQRRLSNPSVSLILFIGIPLYLSRIFTAPEVISPSIWYEETQLMATNTFGVKLDTNPSLSKLTKLGVTKCPKYGSFNSTFSHIFFKVYMVNIYVLMIPNLCLIFSTMGVLVVMTVKKNVENLNQILQSLG